MGCRLGAVGMRAFENEPLVFFLVLFFNKNTICFGGHVWGLCLRRGSWNGKTLCFQRRGDAGPRFRMPPAKRPPPTPAGNRFGSWQSRRKWEEAAFVTEPEGGGNKGWFKDNFGEQLLEHLSGKKGVLFAGPEDVPP